MNPIRDYKAQLRLFAFFARTAGNGTPEMRKRGGDSEEPCPNLLERDSALPRVPAPPVPPLRLVAPPAPPPDGNAPPPALPRQAAWWRSAAGGGWVGSGGGVGRPDASWGSVGQLQPLPANRRSPGVAGLG